MLNQLSLRNFKAWQESNRIRLAPLTVLFGSNLGNANAHTAHDLPILLAGGGYRHGKHIAHEGENAPLCNLFVTLLQNMSVETESFGQSTGTLTW